MGQNVIYDMGRYLKLKKKRFIFEIVITTLGKLCKQIPVSPWDLFNLESYIRTFLDVGSRPQIIGMYSISIFIRKKEIIDFTFGVFACEWRNHSIYMCVIPIRSLFVWRNDSMYEHFASETESFVCLIRMRSKREIKTRHFRILFRMQRKRVNRM